MNADQTAGLLNNIPGGNVCDWKNPVTGFDPIVTNRFLEPFSDFLGQEGTLCLFSAFEVPDDNLPIPQYFIVFNEQQSTINGHISIPGVIEKLYRH